jgi:hypothetical protein
VVSEEYIITSPKLEFLAFLDEFLPYQLLMVVYWTTMVITGNGGLGSDSGEGA